jgi:uncharacterized protein
MNSNLSISYKQAFLYTFLLMFFMSLEEVFFVFFQKNIPSFILAKIKPFLNLIFYPMGFFIFLFFLQKTKKPFSFSKKDFKFSKLNTYVFALISLIGILIFISYLNLTLIKIDFFSQSNENLEKIIKELSKNKFTFFISASILAPILEEGFFRGILLRRLLNNKIPSWGAILFSSFLFGLIHLNPIQFLAGFIMGIFFSFVYFHTQSLLNCILLHSLNNAISVFVIFSGKEKKIEIYFQEHLSWGIAFFVLLIALKSAHYIKLQEKIK